MRPTGAKWYRGYGATWLKDNEAHRGYGVQGVWGTWAIGHILGTGGMGHMGNGSHGPWGYMGNGAHWLHGRFETFLPIASLLLHGFLQKFYWT